MRSSDAQVGPCASTNGARPGTTFGTSPARAGSKLIGTKQDNPTKAAAWKEVAAWRLDDWTA
jgi:hypothetical protein